MSSTIINTNVMALGAHRSIKTAGVKNQKASTRLSSGSKINSGADDAAGIAVSQKMRAQIRGLEQAERNVEDGMSLLMVEDGGMDQISSMIIRARELIVQAINDTNSDEDKKKIQLEVDQLKEEINNCANNTTFNNIHLLNVSEYTWTTVVGEPQPLYAYKAYLSDLPIESVKNMLQSSRLTDDDSKSRQSFIYATGGTTHMLNFNIERYILAIDPDFENFLHNELYNSDGTVDVGKAEYFANTIAQAMQAGFNDNGANFTFVGEYRADGRISFAITNPADASLNMGGCSAIPSNGFGHEYMHMSFSPDQSTKIETGETYTPTDLVRTLTPGLWIQSGANSGQGIYIGRYDCRTDALGIENAVVKPLDAASRSLDDLDNAISTLNTYRATSGAQHNRLEHADSSVSLSFTSLKDSLSRIADADMAKEMMAFTKTQVLSSAGISILAQANSSTQTVLQLFR